ncbi:MAG TPA: DUF3237 domain-containing protein [Solirubrobacteraceae bacterium]|nr:DUF3237 domain-containing protein [Solirubrobacteraceae bacterium]
MTESPPAPGLELLARGRVTLGAPLDLGVTPAGHRRVVPIAGGRFDGPLLVAEVLPGGADWQVIHPGGWVSVLARYTLRAQDGTLISVTSRGLRHGPPEVMERLLAGERPDPGSYRFRTAIQFEATESSPLNHVVAVCSALRLPNAVLLDIYEVT